MDALRVLNGEPALKILFSLYYHSQLIGRLLFSGIVTWELSKVLYLPTVLCGKPNSIPKKAMGNFRNRFPTGKIAFLFVYKGGKTNDRLSWLICAQLTFNQEKKKVKRLDKILRATETIFHTFLQCTLRLNLCHHRYVFVLMSSITESGVINSNNYGTQI